MDRRWHTLVAVCVATFMLLLDITVVNVALPAIQASLGAGFDDLQWVIDAYALALAALLLTAGSLADLYGRRRLFVAGFATFSLASLLCGLSGTPTLLNLARALQGVGGAAMFATSLALIAQTFSGRERGVAFGAWGATTGLAVAIGPLVGGALTEALGWEWIFLVNVPIGLAAIAHTLARVDESRDPDARGVDWAGLITFSGALFLLVFALINANEEGWGSALIVSLLAGAAVLLVAFVAAERRQVRPMLDLALLRNPTFGGASIVAFVLSASMFAMFLYLVLYLQNVLGYSPLEAGLRFLPVSVMSFLVAAVAGRLTETLPARLLLSAGLALVGAGLLLMRGVEAGSDWTALLPGFVVAGAGVGMVNPPLASTAIGVVAPARGGMASGINSTFRQVGIATGIAGLGAIFQAQVRDAFAPLAPAGVPEGLAAAIASGSGGGRALAALPADQREGLAQAAQQAFASGLNDILLVAALVAFAGSVLALALVRRRDIVASGPQVAPVAA